MLLLNKTTTQQPYTIFAMDRQTIKIDSGKSFTFQPDVNDKTGMKHEKTCTTMLKVCPLWCI